MKKSRRRRGRKKGQALSSLPQPWLDADGLHAVLPGSPPSPEDLEEATRRYQQNIRDSPLWDEMVKQFGEEEAERILLQFRVELR
jgi:hypothetical protein